MSFHSVAGVLARVDGGRHVSFRLHTAWPCHLSCQLLVGSVWVFGELHSLVALSGGQVASARLPQRLMSSAHRGPCGLRWPSRDNRAVRGRGTRICVDPPQCGSFLGLDFPSLHLLCWKSSSRTGGLALGHREPSWCPSWSRGPIPGSQSKGLTLDSPRTPGLRSPD